MSSGASIPQLLRIHFSGIGHPDARLSPLTLDFFREDDMGHPETLDSVIWAENGVGKSSIRALLFSLLHPSIHDVMKSSNGPLDNRKYELFFGPKDSSYVVTEWALPPKQQPTLSGLPEEPHTLVVGFAAHWPRNHQTTLSDLDRHFFMFKPEGSMTFDRLPIRGLAKGVEPCPHAKDFMEWFKAQTRTGEGRHTTVHREWSNWLGEEGLDPVLFAYQLRMNGGQGGILGLFKNRINSATDFVHFFLETVMNHDAASDVVSVLNEKKAHIEKKPQWEAEVTFVDEALPLLDKLQEQIALHETAGETLERDRSRAGSLIVGLELSEQTLKHQAETLKFDSRDTEMRITEEKHVFDQYLDYRSWLRFHEYTLEFDQAENRLAESKAAHAVSFKEYHLLKAAVEYMAWQEKLDECKAISAELSGRDDSHQDIEVELNNAGATLAHVLFEEIQRVKLAQEDAKSNLGLARKSLISNQKEFNRTKTDLGKVKEVIRGINSQMQSREKVLRRLVHSQVLSEGELPANAISRWKTLLGEAGARIEKAVEARRELEADRKRILDLQQGHVERMTRCRSELDQLNMTLKQDEGRKKELENDADLKRVAEEDIVNLANMDLPDLIRERMVHLQQEIFSLSRNLADERETLEVIEQSDSKLYPPPIEVARLLRVIREDLKVPAYLGTEDLDNRYADDPEEAERLFSSDLARYMGIIVPTREALEKVREHALNLHRPAFPIQVSYAEGRLCDPPQDAVVLRPGHQAAFNRQAAGAMVEPLKQGIAEKERLISEFQGTVKRLQLALDRLISFLKEYPGGVMKDLVDRIASKQVVYDDLEKIRKNDLEKLTVIETRSREHGEEIKQSEQTRQQAESAIARLRDFMEDHESQFRKLRTELMETRAQLHMLEDRSMQLEATLEEDQRLVARRQEMVFQEKNLLDRRKDELQAIVYKKGEPQVNPDHSLAEVETSYRLCLDRFKQINEKDETLRARLEEKQAMAGEREKRYRKELDDFSDEDVQKILQEGHIDERLSAAEQKERSAAMAVGAAENAISAARDRLREAPTISLDYQPPAEEMLPKSGEAARKRRAEIEDKLELLRKTIDASKEELNEFKDKVRQITEDINFRKLKREELTTHVPDFTESDKATLPGGNEELKKVLDAFWDSYQDHRKQYAAARTAMEKGCDKLKDLANDTRFQDFPNDKREILKVREPLLRQTEDIIKEFLIFRDVIRMSLRMSEESAEAIVTRLDANINDALHLIHLSKSSSRLPETMEGWGGLSFLKVDIPGKVPQNLEDRKPIYERVLRDVLRSGKPLKGLDLIKRGIDALAGTRGYRVEIMKPGYSLKTDYFPVMDVKGWSDGEKITSVILLYCTMVQLRAMSTGGRVDPDERRTLSNGMLFLDNPFGEANSLTFVNMQLTMARALNIQLVYTASGSHKHLMARFPRVVRLSQELGKEKTFVKAADVGHEVRSSVNVTAAHFGRRRAVG